MKTTISALLLFVIFSVDAQITDFSLRASTQYTPETANDFRIDRNLSFISILNDSMAILTEYESTIFDEKQYTPKLGYELMALFTFYKTPRISLRTGIGTSFNEMQINQEGGSFNFNIGEAISQDTIEYMSFTNPGPGVSFCDTYVNSFSDVSVEQEGVNLRILNLTIPFEIQYQLIKRLKISLGGFVQTPIYSISRHENTGIERRIIDGASECEYVHNKFFDKSGNSLNNLKIGLNSGVNFVLNKNLELNLHVAKTFSNTFTAVEYQTSPLSNDLVRPLRLSIGVEYKFNSAKENKE